MDEKLKAKLVEIAQEQKKVRETAAMVVAGAGLHSIFMGAVFFLVVLIVFVRVSSMEQNRRRWKDTENDEKQSTQKEKKSKKPVVSEKAMKTDDAPAKPPAKAPTKGEDLPDQVTESAAEEAVEDSAVEDSAVEDSAEETSIEEVETSLGAEDESTSSSTEEKEEVPEDPSLMERLEMIKSREEVIADAKAATDEVIANGGKEDESKNGTETIQRRGLLHRTVGYTMSGTGCNKKHWTKVFHENDGSGPNVKKNVKPKEEQLVKCLNNINHCNCETRKIAAQLDSIKALPQKLKAIGKIGKGFKRYKTCAIVGNAGHLSLKKYGQYIDNHEFVVRFNVQPVLPYAEYVGSKTSLRMANHRRSLALCCRGNFPEGKAKQTNTSVMIWYPGSQNEIMNNCKRRFPKNPIMNMDLRQGKVLANAVKDMRKTLYRLGVGPFGEWRQLTSGGHAIMFMASICDSISMYGITTYGAADKGGADHYGAALSEEKTRASATVRARSGQKWHDWKGEKYVWRLLNAAGKVNICSM